MQIFLNKFRTTKGDGKSLRGTSGYGGSSLHNEYASNPDKTHVKSHSKPNFDLILKNNEEKTIEKEYTTNTTGAISNLPLINSYKIGPTKSGLDRVAQMKLIKEKNQANLGITTDEGKEKVQKNNDIRKKIDQLRNIKNSK